MKVPPTPEIPPQSADSGEPTLLRCSLHLRREGDCCRGCVCDDDSGKILFNEYVSTQGLMASLRADTDQPVMTCSCTVPECAGFYDQESTLFERHIDWHLRYSGQDLDLFFDRNAYETEALALLRQFRNSPWKEDERELGTVQGEYEDYDGFVQTMDALLAAQPTLAEKWKTLALKYPWSSPEDNTGDSGDD